MTTLTLTPRGGVLGGSARLTSRGLVLRTGSGVGGGGGEPPPVEPPFDLSFATLTEAQASVTAINVGMVVRVTDEAERDPLGEYGRFAVTLNGGVPVPGLRYAPVAALDPVTKSVTNATSGTGAGSERSVFAAGSPMIDFSTLRLVVAPGHASEETHGFEPLHGHGAKDNADEVSFGRTLVDLATGRFTMTVGMRDYSATDSVRFEYREVVTDLRLERIRPAIDLQPDLDSPPETTTEYVMARWGTGEQNVSDYAARRDTFTAPATPGAHTQWRDEDQTHTACWAVEACRQMLAETGRWWYMVSDGMLGVARPVLKYDGAIFTQLSTDPLAEQGFFVLEGAYEHFVTVGGGWPSPYVQARVFVDGTQVDSNPRPCFGIGSGATKVHDGAYPPLYDLSEWSMQYLYEGTYQGVSPSHSVGSDVHNNLRHTAAGNGIALDYSDGASSPICEIYLGGIVRLWNCVNNGVNGKSAHYLAGPGSLWVKESDTNHQKYATDRRKNDPIQGGNRYEGVSLLQDCVFYHGDESGSVFVWPDRENPASLPNANGTSGEYDTAELFSFRHEADPDPTKSVWGRVRDGVFPRDRHSAHRDGRGFRVDGFTVDFEPSNLAGDPQPMGAFGRMEGGQVFMRGPTTVLGTAPGSGNLNGVVSAPDWAGLPDEPHVLVWREIPALKIRALAPSQIDLLELEGTPIAGDGSATAAGAMQVLHYGTPTQPKRVLVKIDNPSGVYNFGITLLDPDNGTTGRSANLDIYFDGGENGRTLRANKILHTNGSFASGHTSTLGVYLRNYSFLSWNTNYAAQMFFEGVTILDTGRTSEVTFESDARPLNDAGGGEGYFQFSANLFRFTDADSVAAFTGASAARFLRVENVGTETAPILRVYFSGTEAVTGTLDVAARPIPQAVLNAWPESVVDAVQDYPRAVVPAGRIPRLSTKFYGGVAPFAFVLDVDDGTIEQTFEGVPMGGERELVLDAPLSAGQHTFRYTVTDALGTERSDTVTFDTA